MYEQQGQCRDGFYCNICIYRLPVIANVRTYSNVLLFFVTFSCFGSTSVSSLIDKYNVIITTAFLSPCWFYCWDCTMDAVRTDERKILWCMCWVQFNSLEQTCTCAVLPRITNLIFPGHCLFYSGPKSALTHHSFQIYIEVTIIRQIYTYLHLVKQYIDIRAETTDVSTRLASSSHWLCSENLRNTSTVAYRTASHICLLVDRRMSRCILLSERMSKIFSSLPHVRESDTL
jgi:hypothetical protein